MKFILGIFVVGVVIMVYNYFEENNQPPRNLIKTVFELVIIISAIIFFVHRYFFLFR